MFEGVEDSFTTRIVELEMENSTLKSEVNRWRNTAAQREREAEEAKNQLRVMLHTANLENQHLQSDIQRQYSITEGLRKSAIESRRIVNEASLVLEKLKSSLPSTDECTSPEISKHLLELLV